MLSMQFVSRPTQLPGKWPKYDMSVKKKLKSFMKFLPLCNSLEWNTMYSGNIWTDAVLRYIYFGSPYRIPRHAKTPHEIEWLRQYFQWFPWEWLCWLYREVWHYASLMLRNLKIVSKSRGFPRWLHQLRHIIDPKLSYEGLKLWKLNKISPKVSPWVATLALSGTLSIPVHYYNENDQWLTPIFPTGVQR